MGGRNKWLNKPITRTSVCDRDELEEFWDRMRKYYISLPHLRNDRKKKWTKKEAWINIIKNLGNMIEVDERVYEVADEALLALIEKAKISALSPQEYALFEAEMKRIGDAGSAECYGYDRGLEDGVKQGKQEESLRYAKELKEEGVPIEIISKISHLPIDEILGL